MTALLFTPEALDVGFSSGAPRSRADGPAIPTRIVGVVCSLWFSDLAGGNGGLAPSAGLFTQCRANLIGHKEVVPINALVRLRGGAEALPAFRANLARVSGRGDIELWDLSEKARAAPRWVQWVMRWPLRCAGADATWWCCGRWG